MLPFRSSRSRTLAMSNRSYFASRTPRATFSKSQKTAMLFVSWEVGMGRVYPPHAWRLLDLAVVVLVAALAFFFAALAFFFAAILVLRRLRTLGALRLG